MILGIQKENEVHLIEGDKLEPSTVAIRLDGEIYLLDDVLFIIYETVIKHRSVIHVGKHRVELKKALVESKPGYYDKVKVGTHPLIDGWIIVIFDDYVFSGRSDYFENIYINHG